MLFVVFIDWIIKKDLVFFFFLWGFISILLINFKVYILLWFFVLFDWIVGDLDNCVNVCLCYFNLEVGDFILYEYNCWGLGIFVCYL